MRRNRLIGFIILIIVAAIISECSSADRNSEGVITTRGELDATETRVGDCFAELPFVLESEESVEFSSIDAIPCSEGHKWQVIHKGSINNLDEYSESLIQEEASKICEEAYEALFLSLSDFKFEEYENAEGVNFSPTPESWKSGDRTVDCIIGSETALFYSSILD